MPSASTRSQQAPHCRGRYGAECVSARTGDHRATFEAVARMQVNATVKRDLRELSKAELLALIDRPGIDGQTSGEDEHRAVH